MTTLPHPSVRSSDCFRADSPLKQIPYDRMMHTFTMIRFYRHFVSVVFLLWLSATASVLPVKLRCESAENPPGIDQEPPPAQLDARI